MEVMIETCCGIDVHQKSIVCCILDGPLDTNKPKKIQKKFGTTTVALHNALAWMVENHVTHVFFESTGQYWLPLFNIFSDSDLVLVLANPQHIKNVPGRKTDVKDAEWIAQLGRCGLIEPSYIPAPEVVHLRLLTRRLRSYKQRQTQVKNEIHNLDLSSSTVYRHIRKGYLSIAPIDLARDVKFKERRKSKLPSIPKEAKKGRSYEDFLNYLALKQLNSWLEMDTVMGRMGGKVLLTFNLSFCNFIFARLLDNKTALEVSKHLYDIKNTLHQADNDFFQLFPVILTDNGGEFARVDDIEMDVRGESKLFFCDPNRSDQKGRIEKNHTLIRDILPKGTSFDNLTQEDINLVCSHVNSVKRAALNGKSAYELFAFTYGEEIPKLFGISKIPAEDVCQSSTLLQHKI